MFWPGMRWKGWRPPPPPPPVQPMPSHCLPAEAPSLLMHPWFWRSGLRVQDGIIVRNPRLGVASVANTRRRHSQSGSRKVSLRGLQHCNAVSRIANLRLCTRVRTCGRTPRSAVGCTRIRCYFCVSPRPPNDNKSKSRRAAATPGRGRGRCLLFTRGDHLKTGPKGSVEHPPHPKRSLVLFQWHEATAL